ncbi:MAG: hypothetical protein COB93_02495 [Sneathiella sp.]|nr:MAG: hypothetical protein COB93_02495 [Sneathiella sp.]
MVPTLKGGGVDHLIVRPTHQYEGEGIYAVQSAYGKVEIFRAQNVGGGNIALLSDNATYRRRDVSVEEFNEMVLGIALHQLHRLRVDTPIVFARCA